MNKISATILAMAVTTTSVLTVPAASAKTRPGVVTAMEPIENRGDDETEGTRKKRVFGQSLGRMLGARLGGTVGDSRVISGGSVAGAAVGEKLAPKVGGRPLATHYMITVKLDSGRVLNLSQLRVNLNGITTGSRVNVDGSGDSARLTVAP